MKSLYKFFGVILLSIFIFSACNENISDPQTASNDQKSLAKQMDKQKIQQIRQVMAANNLGQGAYFIEPSPFGYSIGVFKLSAGVAFFTGYYGKGDFWRINPNGTVSVKLSTNQADAFFDDFNTGEFYSVTGTGHMNAKFTGTIEEYCFVNDEGEEFCFTFLIEDPNSNAWVVNGKAKVTLDGAGGDSHNLDMFLNFNPGGPGKIDFTFN
jgi:hypothetical protein